MIGRIITIIFAGVSAIVLVTFALANRHEVHLVLDPFNPANPVVRTPDFPMFWALFGALLAGIVIGGLSVWIGQGKWRRIARRKTQDAIRWKGEVDRLVRERDSHIAAARELASTPPTERPRSLAIASR